MPQRWGKPMNESPMAHATRRAATIAAFAALTAAAAVTAAAVAPIDGNRTASARAFLWLAGMAAASGALTAAAAADAITAPITTSTSTRPRQRQQRRSITITDQNGKQVCSPLPLPCGIAADSDAVWTTVRQHADAIAWTIADPWLEWPFPLIATFEGQKVCQIDIVESADKQGAITREHQVSPLDEFNA